MSDISHPIRLRKAMVTPTALTSPFRGSVTAKHLGAV